MTSNPNDSFIGEPPEGQPDEQDEREKVLYGLEKAFCKMYERKDAPFREVASVQAALQQMREDVPRLANYEFMEVQASQHKSRIAELERQLSEAKAELTMILGTIEGGGNVITFMPPDIDRLRDLLRPL